MYELDIVLLSLRGSNLTFLRRSGLTSFYFMDRKCFIFFVRADNDFILVWESTDSLVLLWVVEISLSSVEKIELRLI